LPRPNSAKQQSAASLPQQLEDNATDFAWKKILRRIFADPDAQKFKKTFKSVIASEARARLSEVKKA
jgi:hypothetical protein